MTQNIIPHHIRLSPASSPERFSINPLQQMPGLNIEQRTSNPAKYCRQPRRPVSANDPFISANICLTGVGQSKRFLARPSMRLGARALGQFGLCQQEKAWGGGIALRCGQCERMLD